LLNVIGYRRLWYVLSGLLLALSLAATSAWGLRLGIDFTGGSLLEVSFAPVRPAAADLERLVPEALGRASITPLGAQSFAVRLRSLSEDEHQQLVAAWRSEFERDGATVREDRFTSIGPTIGAELRRKAVWSIGFVLAAIVCYIAWAFRRVSRPVSSWQYGLAAIGALFHDVFIPVGIFAVLGRFWAVEVDTLFITALLTVLGFSVHDTIVVFDRIRENLLKSTDSFPQVVNRSVNETVARSINTSLTTLIVLVATLVFGGASVRYFVLTLILGIVFGTYSSIFIASPLLVSWYVWRDRRQATR
jgi:preprotein translocase subunit SecF